MRVDGSESIAAQAARIALKAENLKNRLMPAAREFEGQMLKELLKPLISGGDLAGEDSGGASILREFGAEALGRSLSEHGGFGIANHIVSELGRNGNHP